MTVEELLSRLKGVKKCGTGWSAKCPAHEDRAASLSIAEGRDGRILLKCFSGCSIGEICTALGIAEKDLFAAPLPKPEKKERRIVAAYDYYTKTGEPICRVIRYDPKAFARMSPAPGGGWKWGGTTNAAGLYRWQELASACARGEAVFLVEGEKDCDNARRAGLNAATVLGGASKWRNEYGAEFAGASGVTVIADNDGPGRAHALRAKASIVSAGVPCRAVTLPAIVNNRKVKDISDALAAGWTADEISRWCRDADEIPETPAPSADADSAAIDTSTLRGRIADAIANADDADTAEGRRNALIPAAIAWMREHGGFYFDKEARALSGAFYFSKDRKELMQVASDMFHAWLAWESGLNKVSVDFRYLASSCEDAAVRADWSPRIVPALYWTASEDGATLYLSCGDGAMAKITAGNVEMVDNGTDNTLFLSGRTCAEWKLLDRKETFPLWDLKVMGGASTDDPLDPLLLSLWVLSLPRNLKNRPPLSLCGEIGSGKTRTATGIFEALGMAPRICTAEKSEKGAEEFWVSVHYGGISTIDNVDSRCKWLPDAIAAASTGGQREKRKLYKDDDLIFLSSRSNIIITSANPLYATDAGLADRLINIQFRRAVRETSDSALTREIEEKHDAIMSWIAWTLADALTVKETPPAVYNKRHPDWAAWCWRCGKALGFQEETENALKRVESNKALISILSDQVFGAPLYRQLAMSQQVMEGTAKSLQAWLFSVEEYDDRTKAYLTPHRIGAILRTSRPFYAEVFHMSSRIMRGETYWKLEPPEQNAGTKFTGRFSTRFFRDGNPPGCGDDGGLGGHESPDFENSPNLPFNININNKDSFSEESKNGVFMSTTSTTAADDASEDYDEPFEPEP